MEGRRFGVGREEEGEVTLNVCKSGDGCLFSFGELASAIPLPATTVEEDECADPSAFGTEVDEIGEELDADEDEDEEANGDGAGGSGA